MKEKLLTYYLNDLNRLKDLDMSKLDQWISDYPYCQNLHFLKAKKYQIDDKLDDLSVFHKASTYSTNRSVLYNRLVNSEVERTKYIIEFRKKMLLEKEEKEKKKALAKLKKENKLKEDPETKKRSIEESASTIADLNVEDSFEKEIIEEKSKSLVQKKKKEKSLGRVKVKRKKKKKKKKGKDKKLGKKKKVEDKKVEKVVVKDDIKKKKKKKDKEVEIVVVKDDIKKKKKKEKSLGRVKVKRKKKKKKKGKDKKLGKKKNKGKKKGKDKKLGKKKNKGKKKGKDKKKKKGQKKNKKKEREKKVVDNYFDQLSPSSEFTQWLMGLRSAKIEEEEKNKGIFKNVKKGEKKKKKRKKKSVFEQSKINESLVLQEDIVSESLAKLLVEQGHYAKALDMYEKLSLIFPQKSGFFAAQIEKISKI